MLLPPQSYMESWTCWKTEGAIRVKQNVVRLGNFLGGQHVSLECGDQKLKVFAGRGLQAQLG